LLFVKDVMSRRVAKVDKDSTVLQAAKLMSKRKIGSLVVMDGGKPVGIITEGDVSRLAAQGDDLGRTHLTRLRRRLVVVEPGVRVEDAARTMTSEGVKKLPVVDGGRLVGIVTQTDIVGSTFDLITSLKEMVRARYRPPDFEP
jgi:CBS domain-containing protein